MSLFTDQDNIDEAEKQIFKEQDKSPHAITGHY